MEKNVFHFKLEQNNLKLLLYFKFLLDLSKFNIIYFERI